jgi:hypothetical protein
MNAVFIYLILTVLCLCVALFFMMGTMLGIGLRNWWIMFSMKQFKVRKGWGLVKIFYPTGYPKYVQFHFKDGEQVIEPLGKGCGSYIFKAKCVYLNEYNLPTIDYRVGESDPIDPRTGLVSVTNSKNMENVISGAVKARTALDTDFFSKYKTLLIWGAIICLAIVGAFIFLYMQSNDSLQVCIQNAGRSVIINASSLGK